MAGDWIEEEARRLVVNFYSMTDDREGFEDAVVLVMGGIRAGLAKAAELAAENEACHVCGAELLPPETRPHCEDTCRADDDDSFTPTSERIRALLGEG